MMLEWFDTQKKTTGDFLNLLKARIEKAYPRRKLTAEKANALLS